MKQNLNNNHVNRILQHKGYEALFFLEVLKLLTCRWPAVVGKAQQKTAEFTDL
jgi:hypothetical protein